MNCTICGQPIKLSPSAAERAAKDTSGRPASYYTSLFTEHSECTLRRRAEQTSALTAYYRDRANGVHAAERDTMNQNRKLIASGEAAPATKQLTKACIDCPLRRDALNGWLGGNTPEQYARLCHSDAVVECHVHAGSRCAGLAIYRRNTAKWQPEAHRLPADHEAVFSNMMEFLAHHNAMPGTATATASAA